MSKSGNVSNTSAHLLPGEVILPLLAMRVRVRSLIIGTLLVLAVILAFSVLVGRGTYPISVPEVLQVLVGGGTERQQLVIWEWRMPRALVGLLVGLSLGAAGAVTQSMSRNPLASPDLLGITLGASAGAAALSVLAPSVASGLLALPLAAMAGGILAAALVWVLAWRDGMDALRLVLVGVGVGLLAGAIITTLLVRANLSQAGDVVAWLAGSLSGRGWHNVGPIAATSLVGCVILAVTQLSSRVLGLGDEAARSLGVRATVARGALWSVAVLLTAGAVGAAGPIGFVALASPQVARLLFRSPNPPIVGGALCGAVLLLSADTVAQTIFGERVLPVGVVTAIMGAPFLLYLLVKANRKVTV